MSIVTANSIVRNANNAPPPVSLQAQVEPGFIALGPQHVAAGMNNRVWYYALDSKQCVNEQEYVGTVESVSMSGTHSAVHIDGKIYLHDIMPSSNRTQIFSKKAASPVIAGDFLIYVAVPNVIVHYSLSDGAEVSEFRHQIAIRNIYPNLSGTRLAVIDSSGTLFIYNPVNDDCVPVPDYPPHVKHVHWDVTDQNCFIVSDGNSLQAYYFMMNHVNGPEVQKLSEEYKISNKESGEVEPVGESAMQAIPDENQVMMFYEGHCVSHTSLGGLESFKMR